MAYHRAKRPAIGTKASYPGFIEPALASAIERVPNGERWVHEIKFDGYRVQVHIKDAAVKVFTRRGNDWTNRFRKIAADAWHISAGSAILDGGGRPGSVDGTTDFSVLQNELKGRSTKIVMVAFDLLYLNGYDLRKLRLQFCDRRDRRRTSPALSASGVTASCGCGEVALPFHPANDPSPHRAQRAID
jgi:bifunctional non-homologous end joining protein LigD